MPNWVDCDLKITGKEEELKKFKKYAKTKEGSYIIALSTDKFIPYPEKFKEQDNICRRYEELRERAKKKLTKAELKELMVLSINPPEHDGFNSGGYEWCKINWGTKWGICHSKLINENDRHLLYGFDCAWSPAIPVIAKMSEMFPSLKFNLKYHEEGMGYKGQAIFKANKIIKDIESKYKGGR